MTLQCITKTGITIAPGLRIDAKENYFCTETN